MKKILILRGQILFNPDVPSGIRSLCFLRDFAMSGCRVTLCQVADGETVKTISNHMALNDNAELSLFVVKKAIWKWLNRIDVRIERWFTMRQFNCFLRNWVLFRYIKRTFKPGDFDCVVTSVPDWGMLPLAEQTAKYLNIPWIADYRDTPDLFDPELKNRYYKRQVAWCSRHSQSASLVVTVTEPLVKILESRYKLKNVKLVLNGYDGVLCNPAIEEKQYTERFCIFYAGTMIYGRSMSTKLLFAGLDILIQKGVDLSCVDVVFAGSSLKLVEEDCSDYESYKYAKLLGCIPRYQVLEIAKHANILLSVASPEVPGVLTSKVFEFAMAGVPVLNIPSEDDLVADFVRKANIGYSCATAEGVAEVIGEMIGRWSNSKHVLQRTNPDIEYLKTFSRREQDSKFLSYIEEILV